MRKARSDSKLKTLPKDRQKQILAWSEEHSLAEIRALVRDQWTVETSESALSEFLSWMRLGRSLEQAASFADDIRQTLTQLPNLNLNEEQINSAAQVVFELEAAKAKDLKAFIGLRRLRQKDKDQQHDSRKIQLLERRAAQAEAAERVTQDPAMTSEERERKLREIFGMPEPTVT